MHKLALAIALVAALGSTSVMAATTSTATSTTTKMTTTAKPAAKPVAKPAPAPTVTGAIAAVDTKACTVTIGKTAYHFAANCKISSIKVGEKVTITYKVKGKIDWITKIVVAKA